MKKVLIIQEVILHYRVPVYNELAKSYDLTITGEKFEDKDLYQFNTQLIGLRSLGPFKLINDFRKIDLEKYDVVIFVFNVRFLNLLQSSLLHKKRKFKLLVWGIGVSSENGYDKNKRFDRLRYLIARNVDGVIFYSDEPITRYLSAGVSKDKMFVAHNTLALASDYSLDPKKYFLFVGTLKRYKRIEKLIYVYKKALDIEKDIPALHIIGGGDLLVELKQQIETLRLQKKVKLFGAITDSETLREHYKYAIASISPYQAGLSVLQSLAMGVPFITNEDSVTGGERFNIIDKYNGYLLKNENELIYHFLNLGKKSEEIRRLSLNAYNYFNENCTIEVMVSGFIEAIED